MQSAVTRAKPLWKSTRPNDPEGLCPFSRPSPQVKDGRLKFDVQTQQKSSTIDALILHQNESEELIKCQVEKYALEARAENVVGLVVIISTKESGTQSPFHCLTQVQLLLLDLHPIPVLLADSPADVERLLRRHIADAGNHKLATPPHSGVLAHATASAPARRLLQRDFVTLHGIFGSVQELEAGTRSLEGQADIRDLFTPGAARDIIDFWEDEYLAA